MKTISVAQDFSVFPGGRTPFDGDYSGQEFRDILLIPALHEGNVTVDLDGTRGYGSSFLEEVFGGLIRKGFDFDYLKKNLKIKTSQKSLDEEVWYYIVESYKRERNV